MVWGSLIVADLGQDAPDHVIPVPEVVLQCGTHMQWHQQRQSENAQKMKVFRPCENLELPGGRKRVERHRRD